MNLFPVCEAAPKSAQFIRIHSRVAALALTLAMAPMVGAEDPVDPARTVEQNCLSCHQSGAGNAPRPRHTGDWQTLLENWSYDQLVDNAWEGRGRMPARGFCQSCSREDIEQAVRHMIPGHLLDKHAPDEE